ncbi:MAG: hypothetical protein ACRDOH_07645, partial [Streptosporangiaceae bacterium]
LVNLSGPAPEVVLTGLVNPLSGGQTIQLTLTFAEAGAITFGVPVMPHAYDYATYSPPPIPAPAPSVRPPSAQRGATASGSAPASAPASGSASASPSASPSTTP